MKLHVLYRISDAGNPKEKLKGASKKSCLENALQVFGMEDFHIWADHCSNETLKMLDESGFKPMISKLGNAGSWMAVAESALKRDFSGHALYFLEDDYLHFPGAKDCILEGLERADYVTLYDHPDKYTFPSSNHFVQGGGETGKILFGQSCHWKTTNSTTMTFAVRQETFLQDWPFWKDCCAQGFPDDYNTFLKIQSLDSWENRLFGPGRMLISSIPAFATHTEIEFLAPIRNWDEVLSNGNS